MYTLCSCALSLPIIGQEATTDWWELIGISNRKVEILFAWVWGQKSRWEGVNYLELIPAHRQGWQSDSDNEQVFVLMPRYGDPLFSRLLQPFLSEAKKHIRIPLEGRGSFLWRLVDGQRSVADLVTAFELKYPTDCEDAPERVSMYLHAMYDNNFIKYLNLSD